ncbi:hypothetical protein CARUB_v10018207mg [Capsella rubella]|uniref:Uncharacterized protein n=1 Tax=Capsella rubella TaxID=81985 RepID=R0FRS7_9BRAS|nr:hypothetical protein CARUB_v10018207mg [Capsella rubella]
MPNPFCEAEHLILQPFNLTFLKTLMKKPSFCSLIYNLLPLALFFKTLKKKKFANKLRTQKKSKPKEIKPNCLSPLRDLRHHRRSLHISLSISSFRKSHQKPINHANCASQLMEGSQLLSIYPCMINNSIYINSSSLSSIKTD